MRTEICACVQEYANVAEICRVAICLCVWICVCDRYYDAVKQRGQLHAKLNN